MSRIDGRNNNELRKVKITRDFLKHPQGSVLIEMGETKVICTAMIDDRVPPFLKGTNTGWITAEYSMIPGSTITRKVRESTRGKIEGRSQEIQRLIGRALRSVVVLGDIGERTIWIDCDVIQADGGTRTASITGSFVALADALYNLYKEGSLSYIPLRSFLSAVSVGIVNDEAILDLCYEEDSNAKVDMNIVMTDKGDFVELQGTGEESPFSFNDLNNLIALAQKGNQELIKLQKEALGEEICSLIGLPRPAEKGETKNE